MTRHPPATPVEFEDAFVTGLKEIFEDKILFNRVLGLRITSLKPERVTGRIAMKPDLVGHYSFNRIHGGVISAGLDAMGGLAVMAAIGARHMMPAPSFAASPPSKNFSSFIFLWAKASVPSSIFGLSCLISALPGAGFCR